MSRFHSVHLQNDVRRMVPIGLGFPAGVSGDETGPSNYYDDDADDEEDNASIRSSNYLQIARVAVHRRCRAAGSRAKPTRGGEGTRQKREKCKEKKKNGEIDAP